MLQWLFMFETMPLQGEESSSSSDVISLAAAVVSAKRQRVWSAGSFADSYIRLPCVLLCF